jgi:hypothetical protein
MSKRRKLAIAADDDVSPSSESSAKQAHTSTSVHVSLRIPRNLVVDLLKFVEMDLQAYVLIRKVCKDWHRILNFPAVIDYVSVSDKDLRGMQILGAAKFPFKIRSLVVNSQITGLDWAPLAKCDLSMLRVLTMHECDSIRIDRVFNSLTKLKISHFRNLETVPAVNTLTKLSLSYCPALTVLPSLPNLTSLSVLGCPGIKDLSPISAAGSSLRYLDLGGCRGIADIETLSTLINLEKLDLSDCKLIRSINSVSAMQYLQVIILDGCDSLVTLAPLYNVSSLRYIVIPQTIVAEAQMNARLSFNWLRWQPSSWTFY